MTRLLSHPFRVTGNGNVATAEEYTEDYLAERLALLMTVRNGERPLVEDFGLGDLEYQGVIESAVITQVQLWGIPIVISTVKETVVDDTQVEYAIDFEVDTEIEDV